MDTIWKSINSSTPCKLHRNLNCDSFRHYFFTKQMLVKPNFPITESIKEETDEYMKEVNGSLQN